MRIQDALHTAISGVRHAKMRSFLTMLGIVIGIASVILLMSIGRSAEKLIINQVQGIGSNLVFIVPGANKGSRFASPPSAQGIIIKTLVKEDTEALKRDPTVEKVAPQVQGLARVVYENNDMNATFQGVTPEFFEVRNFGVTKGELFRREDVDSFNRVALIGPELATTLFGNLNPIGKTLRLKNIAFRIVGVLESKGLGPLGVDQDNVIIVPITVAQKQLLGIDYYNVVTVQASDAYNIDYTKSRITSVMRDEHHITDPNKDDFTIRTQEDALALLGNITSLLTIFLTAIASISLVVGGIGIMNIMLVSVIERTKEVGLRKAVGATNKDILFQFLWESIILTFLGGLGGIALGSGLTVMVYVVLKSAVSTGWVFSLPPDALLLGVAVSTCTGIVFGLYPARQASRKSPIEALRYE